MDAHPRLQGMARRGGECPGRLQPIRLIGAWEARHAATGQVIASRRGKVWASCGTRRAAVCPTCADRYAAGAWHLIHAGMSGGKGVPATVAASTRLFVTLTAPSFGPVHNRPGKRPCSCGKWHPDGHPLLGSPIDPDTYDYVGAVLWQAHSGDLWHRFAIALRRAVATAGGLTVRESGNHLRVSYAKGVPAGTCRDLVPVAQDEVRSARRPDRPAPALRPGRRPGLVSRAGGGVMGHVEDRWYKTVPTGETDKKGKPRTKQVKTDLFGKGMRYRVRYIAPNGRERSKSFPDRAKKAAEDFLTSIEGDKLRGAYVDPSAGHTSSVTTPKNGSALGRWMNRPERARSTESAGT